MSDCIITSNFTSLTSGDGYPMDLDPFDLTDCAGDFASDFDMDAVNGDYYESCCEALAAVRPEWCLLKNAEVIGPIDSPSLSEDEAETLGYLLGSIDVTAILQRHTI